MKTKIALLSLILLSGCAGPASVAGLGVWAATGKGTTDHALDFITGKDCETIRIINGEQICQNGQVLKYEKLLRQRQLEEWQN